MKAKALRLPDNLLDAVKFAEKKENLDEPTTIRKLLRLGAEKYIADSYSRGNITLREAAKVLDIPIRNVLELFWDMGISGNLDAADTINALNFVQEKLTTK